MTNTHAFTGYHILSAIRRARQPATFQRSRIVTAENYESGISVNITRISFRQAGFTLIELMIAVSVLAVLMAIAVPSFQDLTRNMALAGAANEVVGGLQFARSEAVRRNQRVAFEAKTNRSWAVFIDANSNSSFDSGDTSIRESSYSDQVTALGAAIQVSFGGAGDASTSTNFCLKVSNHAKSKKITIERSGRPMIEDKGVDCA